MKKATLSQTSMPSPPGFAKTKWIPGTRSIIASLLMGIAMNLVAQIAERLDTSIFAGTFLPFGYVNATVWITVSSILFGPIGGIITGDLHALISSITSTSPVAPFFILYNIEIALVAGIAAVALQPLRKGMSGVSRQTVVSVVTNILAPIPPSVHIVILILGLPAGVAFASYVSYVAIGLIPIPVLTIALVTAIWKSGVLR